MVSRQCILERRSHIQAITSNFSTLPSFAQLGALLVGLPPVQLQHPRSFAAWFSLRQFVIRSFEFPSFIKVEIGHAATLGLLVILQVCGKMCTCTIVPGRA